MALTQEEKNCIFILIQEQKITVQRNEEIRGDELAARAVITTYAPDILQAKRAAKANNEAQIAGLELELIKLDADIATLASSLEVNG